MLLLALGLAAFAIILMTGRWAESNSKDLGRMSRQWLAEYNASHP